MKNADMPAHPTKHNSEHFQHENNYTTGLTKRETAAIAAMQGILSDAQTCAAALQTYPDRKHEDVIGAMAVGYADALLKALEEG